MPRVISQRAEPRRLVRALAVLIASAVAYGCGGPSQPTSTDIFHDPSLRPGALDADESERALLERLDELPQDATIELGGRAYSAEGAYAAASGRSCRRVRSLGSGSLSVRLACTTPAGEWVFVPDVFGAHIPFEEPEASR